MSPQGPSVLSLGSLCLDTNQAPKWTGLRTLLQQLPPQDIDVGLLSLSSLSCLSLPLSFLTVGRTSVQKLGDVDLRPSYATGWGVILPLPEFSRWQ